MVHQPVIPNDVIAKWSKIKSNGLKEVYRLVKATKNTPMIGIGVKEADTAVAWKDMRALFLKMDQNLSAAMKKANSATDDTNAVLALKEVVRVCKVYEPMIEKFGKKTPAHGAVAFAILDFLQAGPLTAAQHALGKLPTARSET